MIILKIYEAHYLTLTAGPDLTTIKKKTQSKSYFYDSLSGPLQKKQRRRRFVTETLCCVYRRFVWRRFV
jgi:hypothetical protein